MTGNRVDIEYPYKQIVKKKLKSTPRSFMTIAKSAGVPKAMMYNSAVAYGT